MLHDLEAMTSENELETFAHNDFETELLTYMDAKTPRTVDNWRITPEQAKTMLAWNKNNRSLKSTLVERLARDMQAGQWQYTGEPIIFSNDRLLDGQHRLHACVDANLPFVSNVTFGVDDAAWSYIDCGVARSPGDVFKMHGVANANDMAAATKLIYSYEQELMHEHSGGRGKLNHEKLYAQYLRYSEIQSGMRFGTMWRNEKLCSKNTVIAAFYICQLIDPAAAQVFFQKVGTNLNFSGPNDPALKLLKFFRKLVSDGYVVRNHDSLGAILTAWNAMRAGRSPRSLQFKLGDPCPRAV